MPPLCLLYAAAAAAITLRLDGDDATLRRLMRYEMPLPPHITITPQRYASQPPRAISCCLLPADDARCLLPLRLLR